MKEVLEWSLMLESSAQTYRYLSNSKSLLDKNAALTARNVKILSTRLRLRVQFWPQFTNPLLVTHRQTFQAQEAELQFHFKPTIHESMEVDSYVQITLTEIGEVKLELNKVWTMDFKIKSS